MSDMGDLEYEATQKQLVLLANIIAEVDIDGFLARAEHADAFGPFFQPTLWMKAKDKLDEVMKLAKAAKVFRDEARRQMAAELAAKGGQGG